MSNRLNAAAIKRRQAEILGRAKKPSTRHRYNKTEERYAQHLESLRFAGQITTWKFEAVKFRLAGKCFYEPDFMVVHPTRDIEFVEVKGFFRDDAKVKVKVVAEQFPMFEWTVAFWRNGRWVYERYGGEL